MKQDLRTTKIASDLTISKIINGMWQVAGGHGDINPSSAIFEMFLYHDLGFTTWDMADIYGPAEQFFGEFVKQFEKKYGPDKLKLNQIQGLTKFVPNPGPMTRDIVEHYI